MFSFAACINLSTCWSHNKCSSRRRPTVPKHLSTRRRLLTMQYYGDHDHTHTRRDTHRPINSIKLCPLSLSHLSPFQCAWGLHKLQRHFYAVAHLYRQSYLNIYLSSLVRLPTQLLCSYLKRHTLSADNTNRLWSNSSLSHVCWTHCRQEHTDAYYA